MRFMQFRAHDKYALHLSKMEKVITVKVFSFPLTPPRRLTHLDLFVVKFITNLCVFHCSFLGWNLFFSFYCLLFVYDIYLWSSLLFLSSVLFFLFFIFSCILFFPLVVFSPFCFVFSCFFFTKSTICKFPCGSWPFLFPSWWPNCLIFQYSRWHWSF